ncbi:hypothetical protein [Halorubrum sp. Ea1]|uniref:hypothetical protein n=1 Tax=Halorubrum sp. Ea1 TaxID=1480718 RepID=UPI001140209E|nr:hypothetical protein [Halorubrum sp. Ea1]
MTQSSGRRSFLALTGTSATAALAGCTDLNTQPQTDGDEGATTDSEATLTVQIRADQAELTSFQEELRADIENGNLSRAEAQQAYQNKQEELIQNATSTYEDAVADDNAVSVQDAEPTVGLLRLTAPAATFVSGLEDGDLAAILPAAYFDQYLQQQQLQENNKQQTEEETNNTSD